MNTLTWSSDVAPVHVIRPDDHIDAVVYGRRNFIVTIPFSRRNSTLRPFNAISRKFKWHRTLNEHTTLLMTISISGSGSVSCSFASATTTSSATVSTTVGVGGDGACDAEPLLLVALLIGGLISLACVVVVVVVLWLVVVVGLKCELLLSVIDAIPFCWIPSLWLLICIDCDLLFLAMAADVDAGVVVAIVWFDAKALTLAATAAAITFGCDNLFEFVNMIGPAVVVLVVVDAAFTLL